MINTPKSLMACGHISSGLYQDEDGNRLPVCIECAADPEKKILSKTKAEGKRFARCGGTCHEIIESDPKLPFFEARPNKDYDLYYNGCNASGWD